MSLNHTGTNDNYQLLRFDRHVGLLVDVSTPVQKPVDCAAKVDGCVLTAKDK